MRPPHTALFGRASTVPVTELRRKRMLEAPDSSRALTTWPSGSVIRVPHGDVQTGLDDALVAERDPDARLRADQAALADDDALRAAAGEGAHGGRAAADVRAVADDDARGDPALDHGGAERARVEVDEALVHDGGPGGEVRAEPDAVGVGDAYALGGDVVRHPGELVDRGDLEVQTLGAGVEPHALQVVDGDRAERGPGDVGEQPEEPVEVLAVRPDEPVRQQVQAQVGVVRVERLVVERGDDRGHGDDLDAAPGVHAEGLGGALAEPVDGLVRAEARRTGRAGVGGQLGGGEPGVEDGAVTGDGGEAGRRRRRWCGQNPGKSCRS